MNVSDNTHPILIVEDDPNDVTLLERAFRKAKVVNPLYVVGNGEDAVSYLAGDAPFADRAEHPFPELVLLDLKLPRKSGHEVLDWIRREAGFSDLPVVVLTSSREEQDVARAYELGANSYLVKPATFRSLQEMVQTLGLYWMVLNVRPGDHIHAGGGHRE